MTLLRPFALERPESLEDVAAVLAEHGSDAALYAGGTELLLLIKEGLIRVQRLVDVKRVPGLADIRAEDATVVIGATARHRALEGAALLRERAPLVAGVACHVANVRVRHVGTVGGNLVFADPHSDLATLFVALDAELALWSRAGERRVALNDFVLGAYETVRRDDEVLTAVRFRPWPAGTVSTYLKFGVHERPTLAVALAATPGADGALGAVRLSVGCVGPRPQRVPEVEGQMAGLAVAELAARAPMLARMAAEAVDTASDLHGSADYKRDMTRVFVRRALEIVAARAAGEEPRAGYPHTIIV
jgi:carbon-monoxide dehydrogenase medium subunit